MKIKIVLSCNHSFHTNACQWFLNEKSGEYFTRIYLCPERRDANNLPIIVNGEIATNPILMYGYNPCINWRIEDPSFKALQPLVQYIQEGKVPQELMQVVLEKVKHLIVPGEEEFRIDTLKWCEELFGHTSVTLKVNIPKSIFLSASRGFYGGIVELYFDGEVSLLSLKEEKSHVGGSLITKGLVQEIYIPFQSIVFKGEGIPTMDYPSYDPELKSFVDSCKSGKKCPVMRAALDSFMRAKVSGDLETYKACYIKLEALYLSGKSSYVKEHWPRWKS